MVSWQQQLKQDWPNFNLKLNFSLAEQTYFKIGGSAEVYLELSQREQIINLVKYCFEKKIKLTLFGGGSNVVVADEGIKGVVLKLTNDQVDQLQEKDGQVLLRAEAGIKTALLVRQTIDMGLTGLEYYLGVPGTLGGAIYNNAHYLAHLISEHIRVVEVITKEGEALTLSNKECNFGYDRSRFQKSNEIVLAVEFGLMRGSKEESERLMAEATQYRAETQPLGVPSSGCVFRNVPNNDRLKEMFPQFADSEYVPTGFLIDKAGLKGLRVGDLEVSRKHAAFFINTGQGTARDLKQLIKQVKWEVKIKFGIDLTEEIVYLD